MCNFAIKDNNNPMLFACYPLNKPCTMCFMGNMNQYYECEKVEANKHYGSNLGANINNDISR